MRLKIITALIACALLFGSCAKKEYSTDYSCRELCEVAIKAIDDGQEYVEYGETYLKYEFDGEVMDAEDYCLIYSVKVEDVNEMGVFLAEDEDAARDIAEACLEYVEELREDKRAFISSYAPAELPKLDEARVMVYGRYVVYAVLDKDSSERAYESIETVISK